MQYEYYDEPPMPIRRRRRYIPEESSNRLLWAFCIALCGFVLYLLFWQPAASTATASTATASTATASTATVIAPNPLTSSNPDILPLVVEPAATTFKVPNDRIFSKVFATIESDLKRCETKYGAGNCEIVGKNPFRKAVYKCANQAADAKLPNVMDWVLKIEDGASRNMTCELPSK